MGMPSPKLGIFEDSSEDEHLEMLATLRDELDAWHDDLELDDLPVCKATSRNIKGLDNS